MFSDFNSEFLYKNGFKVFSILHQASWHLAFIAVEAVSLPAASKPFFQIIRLHFSSNEANRIEKRAY